MIASHLTMKDENAATDLVPGKLYQYKDNERKEMLLYAFDNPKRIYGNLFLLSPSKEFLMLLPGRDDLPDHDLFLVSGSGKIVAFTKAYLKDYLKAVDTDVAD